MKKRILSFQWKQIIALVLLFATCFGVSAFALGYIVLPGDRSEALITIAPFFPSDPKDDQTDEGEGLLTTVVPTTGDGPSPIQPDDGLSTVEYVTNLSRAYNAGMIEGYTVDRAKLSIDRRVAEYNKLAGIIETVENPKPTSYKSYTADAYRVVRGIRLEGDFTDGKETVVVYSKQNSTEDGSYLSVATEYTIDRKKIQPYMGYLLISRVESRRVTVTTAPETTVTPPTLAPSTTTAKTTKTPTTATPTTPKPQTTPAPTTPVQTDAPVTETPVTDAPVTEAPVTETPVTDTPITDAPVTDAPVTDAPETTDPAVIDTPVKEDTPIAADPSSEPSMASAAPRTKEPETVIMDVTVLSLCDSKGKVIINDIGDKRPYYARDDKNRPVFEDSEGKLYAFDGKKFVGIKAIDLRVWLRYDYPAYPLGAYRNYEVEYNPETGKYTYRNVSTGRVSISTDYFKAFNFSDNGLAVVVNARENNLQVINRSKRVQFTAGIWYEFPTGTAGHSIGARNAFRLPDTLGIESIGSIGYDHGWLRIRIQALSQMSNSYGTVIDDWDALVDAKGNYFDIPEGYTLEGYSDGVLLLAKDGLYGYYSIEGKWITQPIFTYARPFIQGLAVVGAQNGTVGMIDTSGNIVLPFVYTSLSDVSSGVITAYCEGIGWETYYLVGK